MIINMARERRWHSRSIRIEHAGIVRIGVRWCKVDYVIECLGSHIL